MKTLPSPDGNKGVAFITDPIFSQRCSPFQFMGPKRVVPPALDAASPALPALDFVLVSHNHFVSETEENLFLA